MRALRPLRLDDRKLSFLEAYRMLGVRVRSGIFGPLRHTKYCVSALRPLVLEVYNTLRVRFCQQRMRSLPYAFPACEACYMPNAHTKYAIMRMRQHAILRWQSQLYVCLIDLTSPLIFLSIWIQRSLI
jgi:hypothetical protein